MSAANRERQLASALRVVSSRIAATIDDPDATLTREELINYCRAWYLAMFKHSVMPPAVRRPRRFLYKRLLQNEHYLRIIDSCRNLDDARLEAITNLLGWLPQAKAIVDDEIDVRRLAQAVSDYQKHVENVRSAALASPKFRMRLECIAKEMDKYPFPIAADKTESVPFDWQNYISASSVGSRGAAGAAATDAEKARRAALVRELDSRLPSEIESRNSTIAGLLSYLGLQTSRQQVRSILEQSSRTGLTPRFPS